MLLRTIRWHAKLCIYWFSIYADKVLGHIVHYQCLFYYLKDMKEGKEHLPNCILMYWMYFYFSENIFCHVRVLFFCGLPVHWSQCRVWRTCQTSGHSPSHGVEFVQSGPTCLGLAKTQNIRPKEFFIAICWKTNYKLPHTKLQYKST
jgi:hypothetical protein